jgi:hypothetical protein
VRAKFDEYLKNFSKVFLETVMKNSKKVLTFMFLGHQKYIKNSCVENGEKHFPRSSIIFNNEHSSSH